MKILNPTSLHLTVRYGGPPERAHVFERKPSLPRPDRVKPPDNDEGEGGDGFVTINVVKCNGGEKQSIRIAGSIIAETESADVVIYSGCGNGGGGGSA